MATKKNDSFQSQLPVQIALIGLGDLSSWQLPTPPPPPISPNSWKVVAGVQADDLPVPVWESWQSGIEKRGSHPEHLH